MTPRTAPTDGAAVAPAVLVGVLAMHAAVKTLIFWAPYQHGVAIPVERATGGLITTVTLAGVLSWVVLVGGGMLWAGRLRLGDVGLSGRRLRDALPVLAGLWLTVQIGHAALGSATGDLSLATASSPLSGAAALGVRLESVVGSGLLEEVLYRGFLLIQGFAWLRGRLDRESALLWAVVASSVYFGVNHIPAYLRAGLPPVEVAAFVFQAAMVGGLFSMFYLRTGNLFVVAGAHALVNDPLALFSAPVDPALVVLVSIAALVLAWPLLSRRVGRVFTVGMLDGAPVA